MALAATPAAPCRREGAGGALTRVPAADTDLTLTDAGFRETLPEGVEL